MLIRSLPIKRGKEADLFLTVLSVLVLLILIGCKQKSTPSIDNTTTLTSENYTKEILNKFKQNEFAIVTVKLKDPLEYLINSEDPVEKNSKKKEYTKRITNILLTNLGDNEYEFIGLLTDGFVIQVNKKSYLNLLNSTYVEEIYPQREAKIN